MGTSNNLLSYDDIRDALDRALDASKGVRVVMASRAQATHLRHRVYKFRFLDRKASKDLYPDEKDRRHGSSIYDCLAIEQLEGVLVIKKTSAGSLRVEELEE